MTELCWFLFVKS